MDSWALPELFLFVDRCLIVHLMGVEDWAFLLPQMFDTIELKFDIKHDTAWYCDIVNKYVFPVANCAQG